MIGLEIEWMLRLGEAQELGMFIRWLGKCELEVREGKGREY